MTAKPAETKRKGWREAIAAYRDRRVLAMLFLGYSAGLPFLLVFSTLSAWLHDANVARSTIGFLSWLGLMYSIKVFWAPVIDTVDLPGLGRWLGHRRGWLLLAQLLIAGGLVGLSGTDPSAALLPVVVFGLLVAFGSATQDIVVDAYRIEVAGTELQAALSAAYIFGYRLALLVAGAGALYIAEFVSWPVAYLSMAGCMLVGVGTTFCIREPVRDRADPAFPARGDRRVGAWFRHAVVGPFREFFLRNGLPVAALLLTLIAVYRLSDITMGVMANPFYLDLGFSKAEIASVVKVFGFGMTLFGAVMGGVFVVRYGLRAMLMAGAVAVAVTNLAFAGLASLDDASLTALAMVVSADNFSGGLANVVFIAFLSGLTNRAYTATQYALFSSLMTLLGKFVGGYAGVVVDVSGYGVFFVYAALLGVPAMVLVAILGRRMGGLMAARHSPDAPGPP